MNSVANEEILAGERCELRWDENCIKINVWVGTIIHDPKEM